jgi:predicted PP-loop superfamily ATPase
MTTLLDISCNLIDLVERLESLMEHPDEQEQALEQWFTQVQVIKRIRDDKIDHYCALIKELDIRITTRKAEAQRLIDRAKIDEKLVQFLKHNLKKFFEQQNLKRIDTRRFKVTLARNGGQQSVNLSIPPEELPTQFQVIAVKANLDAIREALQQGEQVPGASLAERGSYIRIS